MGALRLRIGWWLRASLRSSVVVVVAVAIVVAAVLAIAAGARRTGTAPDRYTASRPDVLDLLATQENAGTPLTDRIAALPSVAEVRAVSFVFGALVPAGAEEPIDALVFAGSPTPTGLHLVDGRDADPADPAEFVATRSWVRVADAEIGQSFQLLSLSPEQAAAEGFDVSDPQGPSLEATLVGVVDGIELDDETPLVVFSPALLELGPAIAATLMNVGLRDGATQDVLRTELDALPGGAEVTLAPVEIVSDEIRTAVSAQSAGLWILAVIAAVAAVAAVGQLLARHVRLAPGHAATLGALGYTRRQGLAEAAARTVVLVAVAVAIGSALAVAPSGIFPFGFVRELEPHPGVRVDAVVMGLGAIVLGAAIVGWAIVSALPGGRRIGRRRGAAVDAIAARFPSSTMATGVRFAYSARVLGTSTIVAGIVGTALVVAMLTGTITFGANLQRFVDDGASYGVNFDFNVDQGADELPPDVVDGLRSSTDLRGATLYRATSARVGDETIAVAAGEPARGNLMPPVVTGDLPAAADEIAIGTRSADDLEVSIGDAVTLSIGETTAEYRVSGVIVPHGLRGNDVVGHGALVTTDGLSRLADVPINSAVIELEPGAAEDGLRRVGELLGNPEQPEQSDAERPPAIRNVARITFVPVVLAVVIALLAALSIVGTVVGSVRRHDRQFAVLRALGAERRWITRAVAWQAGAWIVVPLLVGVPIGIVAGRIVFSSFAARIGAIDDSDLPAVLTVIVLAGAIVVAVAASRPASRRARRLAPATLLRTE